MTAPLQSPVVQYIGPDAWASGRRGQDSICEQTRGKSIKGVAEKEWPSMQRVAWRPCTGHISAGLYGTGGPHQERHESAGVGGLQNLHGFRLNARQVPFL